MRTADRKIERIRKRTFNCICILQNDEKHEEEIGYNWLKCTNATIEISRKTEEFYMFF